MSSRHQRIVGIAPQMLLLHRTNVAWSLALCCNAAGEPGGEHKEAELWWLSCDACAGPKWRANSGRGRG